MNLAKISTNGQITIPMEIRRKLSLKSGDKILFLQKSNGEIVIQNSSRLALNEAQQSMSDVSLSEEDILKEVLNMRYGKPG
jgi:antitoxin PrlF